MGTNEQLWILLDVLIACILGGILGYERESADKPAGLRTNMFIAGSAALLLILGRVIAIEMNEVHTDQALSIDPTRIIHGIILGVGFIGAGTIWKGNKINTVKNLTTAAMLLFSVGVGIAVALKLYILAVGVTILGLAISNLVRKLVEQDKFQKEN